MASKNILIVAFWQADPFKIGLEWVKMKKRPVLGKVLKILMSEADIYFSLLPQAIHHGPV